MNRRRISSIVACLALAARAHAGEVETQSRTFVETPVAAVPPGRVEMFTAEAFVTPDGGRLPYRLLSPKPSRGSERLPLVLVLHGSGAMGDDNVRQLAIFAASWADPAFTQRHRAIVVVPQVAVRSADYAIGDDGLLASRPGASLPAILALVDDLVGRLPVDPSRVYVAGFSMGGSAALNAVTLRPERFAGVVAFSPVPPARSLAPRVASIPMLLVHGDRDTENPLPPDQAWANAVAAAGGRPNLILYRGMDHRIPPDMIAAAPWRAWLLAQRRGGTGAYGR